MSYLWVLFETKSSQNLPMCGVRNKETFLSIYLSTSRYYELTFTGIRMRIGMNCQKNCQKSYCQSCHSYQSCYCQCLYQVQNGRQILPCLEFVGKTYRSHHRHWHPASQELERVGLQQAYHRVSTIDWYEFHTWTKFNDVVYFPLIMNSSDGFTNLEFRIYEFLKGIFFMTSFSMAQTTLNMWEKLVKQFSENI